MIIIKPSKLPRLLSSNNKYNFKILYSCIARVVLLKSSYHPTSMYFHETACLSLPPRKTSWLQHSLPHSDQFCLSVFLRPLLEPLQILRNCRDELPPHFVEILFRQLEHLPQRQISLLPLIHHVIEPSHKSLAHYPHRPGSRQSRARLIGKQIFLCLAKNFGVAEGEDTRLQILVPGIDGVVTAVLGASDVQDVEFFILE